MRVLVTGGRGFVGRHIVSYLQRHYDVLSTDIKGEGLKLDVTNMKDVEAFFTSNNLGQDDLVIHLAARAGNRPSYKLPWQYLFTNITGTLNILEAMRSHGVRKMVFFSAWNVVGPRVALPLNELDPINPDNPYGLSKATGEALVKLYSELYGVQGIVIRPTIIYGPDQEEKNIIQQIVDCMVNNNLTFKVYCQGNHVREFLYVDDICRVVDECIHYFEGMDRSYEIFLIGTERPYSINEVIKKAQAIKEFRVKYVEEQAWCFSYISDMTKAKNMLGLDPESFVDVDEGIKRCYEYRTGKSIIDGPSYGIKEVKEE